MIALFRFLHVSRIILAYRLDTLLRDYPTPWAVRLLVGLLSYLPEPKTSRGIRLRLALESLGPVYVKLGQLLSTRPDLIPADIVQELDKLQDQVPPFAPEEFRQIVESALGASIEDHFASFDSQPLASASVAQVHAATLPSGEEVVIKAIRPGIERTIAKDIKLMQRLAQLLESHVSFGKRLRPVEVIEEYRHTITNELNLQREAANATQLRRHFAGSPLLYVPAVYWDLVRKNVMVMERVYGVPVADIDTLKEAGTDMKVLAERGVEIFFTQVFEHNFFHADMHPGNIFVNIEDPANPSYIALDMAIVSSLNQDDQFYLARNLLAMFRRDYRMVAELHVMSGWVKEETDINEFEAAIRTVCEPIFEKPLKDISFGQVLITLFQTAARFDMTVQPQLVLLQKTLLNIEGLGRQLYPELDLWSTAHPFLERWLKKRFKPKTLVRQLRRYGPEWLEKFPQVPHLVFNGLQQVNRLEDTLGTLEQQVKSQQTTQRSTRRRNVIGIICLVAGAAIGWPALQAPIVALPTASAVLFTVGALAWLIR
ncbi:ubiquinone biosynthesis regulatory protein kinase UbiB [Aurantivibrio plasticivorans]